MKHAIIKTILLAVIVAVIGISASAQPVGPSVVFGIKGGLNMGNFYGDAVGSVDIRSAAIGGGYLRFQMNEILGIQTEALYAQKGAKESAIVNGQIFEGTWKYDYVDVAMLIDFQVPTAGAISPHFYVGPVISILLSADTDPVVIENLKDFTKSTDFGVAIGGGLNFGSGPVKFVTDLRYTLGFGTIDDVPLDQIYSRKNNTISIMGGIQFGG